MLARIRRVCYRAAALVVLVTIVVGVPTVLIGHVGWPLPSGLPSLDQIRTTVETEGLPKDFIAGALSILVWIAWLRLTVALVVELLARLRRRPVPRVTALGHMQRVASGLLAAATMTSPLATRAVFATPATPVVAHLGSSDTSESDNARDAESALVVKRNDSFWSIAERALGNGARWREIVEANVGRQVAPGVWFTETTDTLMPGWRLALPESHARRSPGAVDEAERTVRVQLGDSLTVIAERIYGDADQWTRIWDANAGRIFDGRVFETPNLVLPGWELVIPDRNPPAPRTLDRVRTASAPTPAARALATTTTTTIATTTTSIATTSCEAVASAPITSALGGNDPEPGRGTPLRLGAAVMVGGGALALLGARRRQVLRRSPVRSILPTPEPQVVETEIALREIGAAERLARIDMAVRAAMLTIVEHHRSGRVLGAIGHASGAVEVLIDPPLPAPGFPFVNEHVDANGTRWVLPASVDTSMIPSSAQQFAFPCPALAHLGTSEGGDLYVDLEALGLLVIRSPRGHGRSVLRSIAAGLTVSPFADAINMITSGISPDELPVAARCEFTSSGDAALDLGIISASSVLGVLSRHETTATLRLRSSEETWEPAIVVVGDDAVPNALALDLTAVSDRGGRGLAVITDAPLESVVGWSLVDETDRWTLHPVGIEVVPVGLEQHDIDALRRLLDPPESSVVAAPDEVTQLDAVRPADEDWQFLVKVLGPVEICTPSGEPLSFERNRAEELVVWLAHHRDVPSRSGARSALWQHEVRDATFANVVSEARRTLARAAAAPKGGEWIGRSLSDALPLHERVMCDADLVRARLERARHQPTEAAVETLRGALTLVRDIPFAGSNYLWPDAEGTSSQHTLLVVETAVELGQRYLELGDVEGVFWATGRGLRILPGHEELVALRMRAHAARGDTAAVRHEWELYERVMWSDPWGDGEPSPKLIALRRQLVG